MVTSVLRAKTVESLDSEPLYAVYQPRLLKFVRTRLGDDQRQDAEDVVQETFIELLTTRPAGEIHHPFAYLIRIALRVMRARNLHHGRQCISCDPDQFDAQIADSTDMSPDTLMDALSLKKQMWDAISKLPKKQRRVLYHCKYLGRTYQEAADATGISVHMIHKLLCKAVEALVQVKWDR